MRALVLLGLCLALGLAAEPALGVLYDVDFGSPPHTVGLPPVVGGGPPPRNTISSIPFGTPTVVASFGLLADQPCRRGSGAVELLDPLEPLEDRPGLVHEATVVVTCSRMGNAFEPGPCQTAIARGPAARPRPRSSRSRSRWSSTRSRDRSTATTARRATSVVAPLASVPAASAES